MSTDYGYVKRKRSGYDVLRAWLCVLAALLCCGYCFIIPFERDAKLSYDEQLYSDEDMVSVASLSLERSNYCRDSVYSDLCILGTVYLKNCQRGIYQGTPELYEGMISQLSWFETNYMGENIFGLDRSKGVRGLKIDQSQYTITSIDSDYYYFFVSYGDEYISNIPEYRDKGKYLRDTVIEELCKEYSDWYYLRRHNIIYNMSKYEESGLGKKEIYYTVSDISGKSQTTSEYLDSDKLMLGGASLDNYGNYRLCFDSRGDLRIESYSSSTNRNVTPVLNEDGTLTVYGEIHSGDGWMYDARIIFDPGDREYIKAVNEYGGASRYNGEWISLEEMPDYKLSPINTYDLTVFMAPKEDLISKSAAFINKYRDIYIVYHYIRIGLNIAWIVFAVAAVILTLTRPVRYCENDGGSFKARIFNIDISLILMLIFIPLIKFIFNNISYFTYGADINYKIQTMVIAGVGLVAAHIAVMLSAEGIIRHIKVNGIKSKPRLTLVELWKNTKGARSSISSKIADTPINKWFSGLSVKVRYLIMYAELVICALAVIISCMFSMYEYGHFIDASWPFILLLILLGLRYLFVTMRLVNDLSKIEQQTDEMFLSDNEKGKSKPVKPSSPLKSLSNKLGEVSVRANEAVEQQVKSEKMKVELVTNVSHDLKTPLTSIISYIDLLEKTELSDEARGYVSILSRKSEKLRDIVQDVFSLAKAVSDIDIELEMIDMAILTRQVIGDNTDNIENSGKELRSDIKPETAKIKADGAKLYRVIQNLLDNALKYSMPGTRIYLTLSENERGYELTVKNVSEKEMNFTAEEITERFARGDESRTDGGSGLGLSIAQSFTEACKGRFGVEIDGDVFKATVSFDRVDPDAENNADPADIQDIEPIIDSTEELLP